MADAAPDAAAPGPTATRAVPQREATVRVIPRTEVVPAAKEGELPLTTRAAATEDEVEIAISSEAGVERLDYSTWPPERYIEVLGHADGEIDLSYARDGMPYLIGHDDRERVHDQVGIVENITLGKDRVLRGRVRFSKAQRAQEIRQDMLDGIRKKVSVGYDPGDDYEQSEDKATGVKTRRYRGWRPLEASSVPIPADYDVGVGRTGAPRAVRQPDIRVGAQRGKEQPMATDTQVAAPATAPTFETERKLEAERVKEIREMAVLHDCADKIGDWIGGGASVAEVQRQILATVKKRSDELLAKGGGKGVVQLTDKEEKAYSIVRAIQRAAEGQLDGFEREVSDEIAKRTGKSLRTKESFFAPTNLKGNIRGMRPASVTGSRVSPLAAGTSDSGQQLVFTEYAGFIPLLRNKMMTRALGARVLGGLQGNPGFVTQPSASTFQWIGETTSPSATSFGTGLRTMTPHNGAALTAFSRQLLAQSSEDVESLVWDDLAKVVALGIDLAAIAGTGSNNQPTGILNTTGIGAVTIGTAGGTVLFSHLVGLETELTADNADLGTMAYLTTPQMAGNLKQLQQFSGTNGIPVWTGTVHEGLVNGYRASISKQVPSNLTKGSNTGTLHAVVFGVWSELLIGEWGAMEMIVDPYTSKPTLIEVAVHCMYDVFLRYIESFAAIKEAIP